MTSFMVVLLVALSSFVLGMFFQFALSAAARATREQLAASATREELKRSAEAAVEEDGRKNF